MSREQPVHFERLQMALPFLLFGFAVPFRLQRNAGIGILPTL
jgi:hypothetical protein